MFHFLQFYCPNCNEWFTQMQRVAFLLLYETYLITRDKINYGLNIGLKLILRGKSVSQIK